MRLTRPSKQRGSTLIVCLVILTVLTFLGLNSMTDNNLQSVMVRNNQLQLLAYNTALSEINAQIDLINRGNDNTLLLGAMNDSAGERPLLQDELLMRGANNPFTQQMMMAYVGGSTVANCSVSTCRGLRFEISSDALLLSTNTQSNQIQGIEYSAPAAQ